MKYSRIASFIVVGLLISVPFLAFADDSFVPLTSLPGLPTAGNTPDLAAFLNQIYRLCIGAAAVITVIQIIRGGAMLMTSQASFSKNKAAKDLIQNSLLGLLLVLSPTIVFGIINPKILNLSLDFSSLKSTPSATTGATTAPAANAGDGTCTVDCVAGLTCQKGACVVASTGTCTAFSGQTTITTEAQVSCCQKQSGCQVQMVAQTNDLPKQVCTCGS